VKDDNGVRELLMD